MPEPLVCPSCGGPLVQAFQRVTDYVRCPKEGSVYAVDLLPKK